MKVWVLSIGVAAGVAFAQQEGGRGMGRGRGPMLGFSLLDVNADGSLAPGEIDGAPSVLAKLDKNSDGEITPEEVRPPMPEGRGVGAEFERRGRGARRGAPAGGGDVAEDTVKTLMAFDANNDGKLSKTELPERMQGMFDRADEDKDAFLTTAEIRKFAAAQASIPPSAGPRGRGGADGDPRGGFGRPMNFIRFDPVLAAIDADGDGVITTEEIRKSPESIRKLDKNGDGSITRDEATPAPGPDRGFGRRNE